MIATKKNKIPSISKVGKSLTTYHRRTYTNYKVSAPWWKLWEASNVTPIPTCAGNVTPPVAAEICTGMPKTGCVEILFYVLYLLSTKNSKVNFVILPCEVCIAPIELTKCPGTGDPATIWPPLADRWPPVPGIWPPANFPLPAPWPDLNLDLRLS